ncbi:C40 family peptidase [Rhodovulum adriaticum]|uniref:Cell wall-associated NlpC family hydrolase n=1 Tax=Rhodovulum adriaticum TaxID=35804 RepID=A0A4R2NI38_RHOAD|nr:NlpC/P60 family protein [Rhodovulum adriaticum]MBK1637157.1 NLP/P60 hydrolase [Rhodovulum adriaticum]TCP20938.1 cell wall-associated NlpC family hydrolase [Rhodovulum adriaticum]
MTDRRETFGNGRVAAETLRGQVAAQRYVAPVLHRVTRPLVDLLALPGGARDRQLVLGEGFEVLDIHDGHAFGRAARDGYVGYIPADALAADVPEPTHIVAVPASHAYSAPDLKRPEIWALSFGTRLRVVSASGAFFETAQGWFVPKPHLRPANAPFADPVTVAQMLFGAPYLWGGNAIWGLDCSALVQMAHLACHRPCPGDSDQQARDLGRVLPPGTPPERGDLLFWKGHVALVVERDVMIHANAHTMSVAYERIEDAIARIEAQGDGPVTAHKRP